MLHHAYSCTSGVMSSPKETLTLLYDSACSRTMIGDMSLLSDAIPCNIQIDTVNGSLHGKATGNLHLTTLLNGKHKTITLKHVIAVPGLCHPLLSASGEDSTAYSVHHSDGSIPQLHKNQISWVDAKRVGAIYCFDCHPTSSFFGCGETAMPSTMTKQVLDYALWHAQLGHVGPHVMKMYTKLHNITWTSNSDASYCHVCFEGHQRPSTDCRDTPRATTPLVLLHLDAIGTLPIASKDVAKYIVTITDDYSKYTWAFAQRSNDCLKLSHELKSLILRLENSTGIRVAALRRDQGHKFVNIYFREFTSQHVIQHEFVTTHTPEQNGLAERHNCALMEQIHLALLDTQLPPNL
jgi:hypothetical protein